ncbi:MAG: hypothetical protein ACE5FJ_01810 [Gemmatimonadales bacterium]
MVTIVSLWLPILLATVLLFIASFVLWALLPYHTKEWRALPDEERLTAAMRDAGLQPGQYSMPFEPDQKKLADPAVQEKFTRGPVGFLYVRPSGLPAMGRPIVQQIFLILAVMITVAYLLTRTLDAGADYLQVFRVAGTITWVAFSVGHVQSAVWFAHSWSDAFKNVGDSLVYAVLAGGAFGAFWPN